MFYISSGMLIKEWDSTITSWGCSRFGNGFEWGLASGKETR
jgi:hypothetical protein